jgi:hypothetical protein
MSDPLTARQRQTLAARQAFADRFTSPEERTEHYRSLGRKSAAHRVVLSGYEASALAEAYALLARIVARTQKASNAEGLPKDSSDSEVAAERRDCLGVSACQPCNPEASRRGLLPCPF